MFTSTRFALVLSILLIGANLSAQTKTAQVQWGEARNEKEHGAFDGVIHRTDDLIFVKVLRKKEMWIQVFDKDLRMLGEREVPMVLEKKEHVLDNILVQGDRTYVFSTVYDKSKVTSTLYVRIYSGTNLAPQGALKKVHSVPVVTRSSFLLKMGGLQVNDFTVSNRENRTGFRVRENAVGARQGNSARRILLFDENLGLDGEEDEEVKPYHSTYASDEFYPEATLFHRDGSKLVVGRKYPEKEEKRELKRQGNPTYDMALLAYGPEGGMPQATTIPSGDRFLQDITMRVLGTGDILCAGFWGDKGSWTVRGAFFMRLDGEDMGILHQSFSQFDDGLITQYMSEKEAESAMKDPEKKGNEIEWFEYDLADIILRDDGGAVLVAEQYRIREETKYYSTASNMNREHTVITAHYYDNDIVVVNIGPKGDIEWAAKIPKRQYTKNDDRRYSSYALTVKNDKMYFVFNDSGKNLGLRSGDQVHQFDLQGKGALISVATVDEAGHVHREALLAPDSRDAILSPKECVQMEDDRMLIHAILGNEYRYGMITFD